MILCAPENCKPLIDNVKIGRPLLEKRFKIREIATFWASRFSSNGHNSRLMPAGTGEKALFRSILPIFSYRGVIKFLGNAPHPKAQPRPKFSDIKLLIDTQLLP